MSPFAAKLTFEQKMIKGKKAPELMEEAIELLLKKYSELPNG